VKPSIKLRTLAASVSNGYYVTQQDREAITAILEALADRVDQAEQAEQAEQPQPAGPWPCATAEQVLEGLRRIANYHRRYAAKGPNHAAAVAFLDEVHKGVSDRGEWPSAILEVLGAATPPDAIAYARAAVKAAEDRDAARALLCRSLGREPSEPLSALVGELLEKLEAIEYVAKREIKSNNVLTEALRQAQISHGQPQNTKKGDLRDA